jgi:hypothetical protein
MFESFFVKKVQMDIYLAVFRGTPWSSDPLGGTPGHQNPLRGFQTYLPFKEKGRGSGEP